VTIEIAEPYGFCFGVRRAVKIAEEEAREHGKVFTYGPLMHNPQEVARLERSGIAPLEPGTRAEGEVVIIRSHGAPVEEIERLEAMGGKVIDATCPLVQRAQRHASELARRAYQVLVLGDRAHPEVGGILSRAPEAIVVEELEAMKCLKLSEKVGIVAQTTQSQEVLGELVQAVVARGVGEIAVFNTICSATSDRQAAAAELAGRVDCVFVLGGRESANTGRLAERCKERNARTFHLETHEELSAEMVAGAWRAGVAAGASTPEWIVHDFVKELRRLCGRRNSA